MPPSEEDYEKLRARLDECMIWPTDYVFKFIVPASRCWELRELFSSDFCTERASAKGRYVSLTIVRHVECSDEIISTYKLAASHVPGVIML